MDAIADKSGKMDGFFWSLVLEFGSFFALFQTRFGPLQES